MKKVSLNDIGDEINAKKRNGSINPTNVLCITCEIMNEITRITNGEITVGAGSLYTLLPKFEKECYIKLVKVVNNKKIYQITNLGKKKLQKEKERMLKQISLLDQIGG